MIDRFVAQLRERPEFAFFVTITLGYAIGRIRLGSFTLGAVTGVLLAGVLVGQLGITLPGAVKQIFFLLFLFSIGYRTGPQFFRGLKKGGLAQAGGASTSGRSRSRRIRRSIPARFGRWRGCSTARASTSTGSAAATQLKARRRISS